jgi:hypothetical protein
MPVWRLRSATACDSGAPWNSIATIVTGRAGRLSGWARAPWTRQSEQRTAPARTRDMTATSIHHSAAKQVRRKNLARFLDCGDSSPLFRCQKRR